MCNGTKSFLAAHGFWYRDYSLTEKENLAAMRTLRGSRRGIPVIQIDDDILVGFDRHALQTRLHLF